MRTATSGATAPKGGGQRASCAACADEGPSRPLFLPIHASHSGRSRLRGLGPVSSVIWSTVTLPAKPRHETNACAGSRSEEHTSELQSLRHLVCRLLLEKKKKKQ